MTSAPDTDSFDDDYQRVVTVVAGLLAADYNDYLAIRQELTTGSDTDRK